MLNLLSGEFYKLRKGKSIYMCCLASVFFILFVFMMLVMVNKIQNQEVANGTMGITVTGSAAQQEGSVFDEVGILDTLQQVFGNGFSAIAVTVFTCLFVLGEYANGAVKNIVGKGYPRWKIFLAKYLTANLAAAGMMVFMSAVTVLCGIFVMGSEGMQGAFFYNLCVYTGIEVLLGMALNGIVIFISEITRSVGAGISISLCVVLFSTLFTGGLDLFLHKTGFRLADYWVLDLMGNCPVEGFELGDVLSMVLMAVAWMAVSFAAGMMHFKKADV